MNDRKDIETLFKMNYRQMHSLASAMLHDREAAHDIVHDVFATILNDPPDKKPDPGYLMVSVRNRCLNRLKALDIREKFRKLYLLENNEIESFEDWPDKETIELIRQCISEMPAKCREVYQLRYQDGKSAAEISQILGTGERVIYKHLRHALNIIKTKLNGQS